LSGIVAPGKYPCEIGIFLVVYVTKGNFIHTKSDDNTKHNNIQNYLKF